MEPLLQPGLLDKLKTSQAWNLLLDTAKGQLESPINYANGLGSDSIVGYFPFTYLLI